MPLLRNGALERCAVIGALERFAVILDLCTLCPLVRDVSDTPNLTEQCLIGVIAEVVQFH